MPSSHSVASPRAGRRTRVTTSYVQSALRLTDAETASPSPGSGTDTSWTFHREVTLTGRQDEPSVQACESGLDVVTATRPEYVQSSSDLEMDASTVVPAAGAGTCGMVAADVYETTCLAWAHVPSSHSVASPTASLTETVTSHVQSSFLATCASTASPGPGTGTSARASALLLRSITRRTRRGLHAEPSAHSTESLSGASDTDTDEVHDPSSSTETLASTRRPGATSGTSGADAAPLVSTCETTLQPAPSSHSEDCSLTLTARRETEYVQSLLSCTSHDTLTPGSGDASHDSGGSPSRGTSPQAPSALKEPGSPYRFSQRSSYASCAASHWTAWAGTCRVLALASTSW